MDLSTSPPLRGYAWFVYPDGGSVTTENPFSDEVSAEGTDPGTASPPEGVVAFMTLDKTVQGLHNDRFGTGKSGHCYLVVGRSVEPPALAQGWIAEPAHIDESFQVEQRGTRWVRLRRILHGADTPGGLKECEFEVVKG